MRYETTTTLAPAAALAAAERFFAGGLGLTLQKQGTQMLGFSGGGGHVEISVVGEHPTTLELTTREWDTPVLEFLKELPR